MNKRPKFEVFKGKEWYFRLRGANGEIVCQSEGYTTKADALRAAWKLPTIALAATMELE